MNKKALLIGINYVGTPNELNGCINDTLNLKKLFITENYFNDIILMNEMVSSDSPLYPSKKNIINQLNNLVDYSNGVNGSESTFIFFAYSGHGSYTQDKSNDEIDGKDEMICPVDFNTNGFITDDYLRQKFVNLLPSNCTLICIIDSCHSATVFDLKYIYNCDGTKKYKADPNLSETKCNIIVLSGCLDNQTSADTFISNVYQGAMTASFLSVFYDGISLETLLSEMKKTLKRDNMTQIPQLTTGKYVNTFDCFPIFKNTLQKISQDFLYILTQIKTASYGSLSNLKNVTQLLKASFINLESRILISNALFGDPSPGFQKKLTITFFDEIIVSFEENVSINLKDIYGLYTLQTGIKNIYYGSTTKTIDVSIIVKSFFTSKGDGVLNIKNSLFGDPHVGNAKYLELLYKNNVVKRFDENTGVRISDLYIGSFSTDIIEGLNAIQIIKWGKSDKNIIVTNTVKNIFKSGNTLTISTTLLKDPCPGEVKTLSFYLSSGKIVTFEENRLITLDQVFL